MRSRVFGSVSADSESTRFTGNYSDSLPHVFNRAETPEIPINVAQIARENFSIPFGYFSRVIIGSLSQHELRPGER